MKIRRPILIGASGGLLVAIAFVFLPIFVQMQGGDNPLFKAVLPLCIGLANIFMPNQDMAGLFFALPLMIFVPIVTGAFLGLVYAVLKELIKIANGQ